jgi:predicted NBD/HSP70 family sugar kinase
MREGNRSISARPAAVNAAVFLLVFLCVAQARAAAERGDRLALEAFEYTGRILGMKLADSVAHLSPEAIILFGGLALAGDYIFRPTRQALEENLSRFQEQSQSDSF